MRMLNGSCMWWETAKDDESKYWTTCAGSPEILNESDSELAEMCWMVGAEFCPFCGKSIDYLEETEARDEFEAENEYRTGIRDGLYGY